MAKSSLFWAALILLGFSCPIQAQISPQAFIESQGWAIKLSPLASLEPIYNTFEAGFEYKFKGHYALQGQIGYGNSETSPYTFGGEDPFRTLRFRLEGRWYWAREDLRKPSFFAVELVAKNTHFFEQGLIGRECDEFGCAFQELARYRTIKNVIISNLKFGKEIFINDLLSLEFFGGLGLRIINVEKTGNEIEGFRDFIDFDDSFFQNIDPRDEGQYLRPSLNLGLKLGFWRFKK